MSTLYPGIVTQYRDELASIHRQLASDPTLDQEQRYRLRQRYSTNVLILTALRNGAPDPFVALEAVLKQNLAIMARDASGLLTQRTFHAQCRVQAFADAL